MASPKKKGKTLERKKGACVFCNSCENNEGVFGKLLSKAGITAHYFCMLFSSGLSQNGKSEKQGILGFLPGDVHAEVRRGARLRCSYCKNVGATIGCVVKNCKKMFHFGCGRENDSLHQFFDTFSSFCKQHRPIQDVAPDNDPNIVCSICREAVVASPSSDTLKVPCCRKNWLHVQCVQMYATSAGLHHFKCPLCNNKDDFQDEMLACGIFIPEQDASWETEPNAFQELLERYNTCDAASCLCVEGRKYDKAESKWEITLCDFCGSSGSHVACKHLVDLGRWHVCPDCFELDKKFQSEHAASGYKSPIHKRLSLEGFQSSPDSTKATSPYPGPSNKIKKRRLPQKVRGSPIAGSSKSQQLSMHEKEAKRQSNNARKRMASPDFGSPPRLKKQKYASVEAGMSGWSAGHGDIHSYHSTSTSSYLSSDSEDNLPLAWQTVEAKRKYEKKSKNGKKIKNNMPSLEKEDKSWSGSATGSKSKGRKLKGTSTDSVTDADSEVDFNFKIQKKNYKHKNKTTEASRRYSLAGSYLEKSPHRKGKARLSLEPSVKYDGSKQGKRKYTKRQSNETDHSQLSLMQFFSKMKDKDISNNLTIKSEKYSKQQSSSASKRKAKIIMEWHGQKIIISSPKVMLSRVVKRGKIKPRNLEIDMSTEKGNKVWNSQVEFLSTLETDGRVTRNMLEVEEAPVDRYSSKSHSARKKLKSNSETPVDASKSQVSESLPLLSPGRTFNARSLQKKKTKVLYHSTQEPTEPYAGAVNNGSHRKLGDTSEHAGRSQKKGMKSFNLAAILPKDEPGEPSANTESMNQVLEKNPAVRRRSYKKKVFWDFVGVTSDEEEEDSLKKIGNPESLESPGKFLRNKKRVSDLTPGTSLKTKTKNVGKEDESNNLIEHVLTDSENNVLTSTQRSSEIGSGIVKKEVIQGDSPAKNLRGNKAKSLESDRSSNAKGSLKLVSKKNGQFENSSLTDVQKPSNNTKDVRANKESEGQGRFYSIFNFMKKPQNTVETLKPSKAAYKTSYSQDSPTKHPVKDELLSPDSKKLQTLLSAGCTVTCALEMAVEQRTPTSTKDGHFSFDIENMDSFPKGSPVRKLEIGANPSFNDSPAKNLRARRGRERTETGPLEPKLPLTPSSESKRHEGTCNVNGTVNNVEIIDVSGFLPQTRSPAT